MLLVTELVHGVQDSVRAPRGNNLAAIFPDRSSVPALIEVNRAFWRSSDVPSWIRKIRLAARRQLAELALDYAASYQVESPPSSTEISDEKAWILGGHQPELFHPGVWFKNILIDRLARETNSLGLHAIIDHDLARATYLRIPVRETQGQPIRTTIVPLPITRPETPETFLPWNAWQIDRSKIEGTSDAIEHALSSVGANGSMANDYFHRLENLSHHSNAALAFSQARHLMERKHGIGNWEFPMSSLCRGYAWHAFVAQCIEQSSELNQAYNDCLEEYRTREGITNPAQPVPRLGRSGPWFELPFWIRLPGQLSRSRMWVSRHGSGWHIAPDPESGAPRLPWSNQPGGNTWLVWPRALTTTLFLRTFVADLFVHGIGGGQYDRLTDAIIERFLRIVPPKFITCTATVWLAFPKVDSLEETLLAEKANQLKAQRQRLRSAPERFLDPHNSEHSNLADAHQKLLTHIPPRGQRKTWDREMRELKNRIVAAIEPHRLDWDASKAVLDAMISEQKILQSREFSYVLFEEQDLLNRLLRLAEASG
jgi:hypothetical protein